MEEAIVVLSYLNNRCGDDCNHDPEWHAGISAAIDELQENIQD